MRLTQRTASHLKETADGLRLLAAQRAGSSEPIQFPPPEFMHGDADIVEVPLGPTGVLYTYTVVHPGRDKTPYALAMVDFEPGVRVFGRLMLATDAQLPLGSTVRLIPHSLPDGEADYAFAALEEVAV